MALREVLEVWNPWLSTGEVPSSFIGIKRECVEEMARWLNDRVIKVVIGPRRAGKTTVMYQLIDFLIKNSQRAIYINFEDPEIKEAGFKRVYEEAKKIGGKGVHLFLDEIQNIAGWENYVRAYYDRRDPVNFIISGSTLAMMGREFQKKLAGRFVSFKVFPFSLREAMRIRGIRDDPRDREALLGLVEEMMTRGSYPEIFLENDPQKKKRLLLEYYESIIARDVAAGHDLDVDVAEQVAHFLLRHISSKVSVNGIAKMLKIAYHTAEKYLRAFVDSMVFFELKRFSYSLKERMAFPRKVYPFDLGFRWAVAKGHSSDMGRLFEAFVASELVKRGYRLFYWEGKRECDFVLSSNGKPFGALQVSWAVGEHNEEREREGLKEAMRSLRLSSGFVLSKDSLDSFLNLLTKNANPF